MIYVIDDRGMAVVYDGWETEGNKERGKKNNKERNREMMRYLVVVTDDGVYGEGVGGYRWRLMAIVDSGLWLMSLAATKSSRIKEIRREVWTKCEIMREGLEKLRVREKYLRLSHGSLASLRCWGSPELGPGLGLVLGPVRVRSWVLVQSQVRVRVRVQVRG
ncbi:unnamed protein product [Ilex paraguariensis]|uniref:Uncharacterized protein n=1 Tax=Ilex paraguariensis TaxID=185542 RepID=A0ABC8RDL2_9AQUA